MSSDESESTLKNRKPVENPEKVNPVEPQDVKKVKAEKTIETKDIRNLPVSLQRGKSNHKWLAMMTVLGALLLKLLNEYNDKKKNKDTFYTKNVDVFKNYSEETSFLTYPDEINTQYPYTFEPENITLVGNEYVKYDVEEVFIKTWEDYHFNKNHANKIGYVAESLDTKLLMFNNTQSFNHRLKFKYLIEQDLRIIRFGKEFDIPNVAFGGLTSSYNLLTTEMFLKSTFPEGAKIIKDQIILIAERVVKRVEFEDFFAASLDLQVCLQMIKSSTNHKELENGISSLINFFGTQFEVSDDLDIRRYSHAAEENHFKNGKGDISAFWKFIDNLKANYTKTTNISLPLKKKSKKSKLSNKLTYVGISPQFDVATCKLPTSLLLAVTKGFEQSEISKHKNLFDDIPDMKENYDYALELVRSCYHIFMESESSSTPSSVLFNDGYITSADHKNMVLSKYGSFYYDPTSNECMVRDDILEAVYNAYYVSKSRTFQLWVFEIFEHYVKDKSVVHDETWFAHTLKYLYLSFLNDNEGVDHKKIVFTQSGHMYPVLE